jgi:predicted HD phosphohydrolase
MYDDAAKVPDARTPRLDSYRELLDRLATSAP